jgi:hypothetical protein
MTVMEGPIGDAGLRGACAQGAAVVVVRSALGPYRALIHEAPPDARKAEGHLRVAWDSGRADGCNRHAAEPQIDTAGSAAWARACADVLYGIGAPEHAARTLRRYAGCLLATARDAEDGGRCVAVARGGTPVAVTATGAGPACGREHALMASLLHAWLEAALPLEALASAVWTFPWPGRRGPAGGAWVSPGARIVRVALSPLAPKAIW